MSGMTWWMALPPALPLAMTMLNVATWTRGDATAPRSSARVSILIPARNEEGNIVSCVRAALADTQHVVEVIVYDDQSSDRTAALVRELASDDARVRLLAGTPLPSGWIGKPHACHRLAESATGDVLLFVDADTRLDRDGVARLLSLLRPDRGPRAATVTAVPRQDVGSPVERLIVPLLVLTYTSWFPLALVGASRDPRFLAANGQILAVERSDYDATGGFESVRNELVDDMAFCRRMKMLGRRVVFADGFHVARCRMYEGGAQVWRGFSKNLYEGIGGSALALGVVVALYAACFVAPYALLAIGAALGAQDLALVGAVGVGANVVLRLVLSWRFDHPLSSVLLHPFAVLGLLGIAFNSRRWSIRNRLEWRGRTYRARKERVAT